MKAKKISHFKENVSNTDLRKDILGAKSTLVHSTPTTADLSAEEDKSEDNREKACDATDCFRDVGNNRQKHFFGNYPEPMASRNRPEGETGR